MRNILMLLFGFILTHQNLLSQASFVCGNKMKDYDGNLYNTVQIGAQCWMKENLRTSHDRNGILIPISFETTDDFACRLSPNNASWVVSYGYKYNWLAARIACPRGWHLPTAEEFEELRVYCSNHYSVGNNAVNVAKSLASKSKWFLSEISYSPGNYSSQNNASGFSAYPVDIRAYNGIVEGIIGKYTQFWSSTPDTDDAFGTKCAFGLGLSYEWPHTTIKPYYRYYGFSVRCVRD